MVFPGYCFSLFYCPNVDCDANALSSVKVLDSYCVHTIWFVYAIPRALYSRVDIDILSISDLSSIPMQWFKLLL